MKHKGIVLVILTVAVLACILIIMNRDTNVVIYENYVAEHNDNKIVYTFEDETVGLSMRWMNENITKGMRLFGCHEDDFFILRFDHSDMSIFWNYRFQFIF